MSKEAAEAFDKWYLGKVLNVGVGDAFRAGWAEKQRRDLVAVAEVDKMLPSGWHEACDKIAARIKGDNNS